MAQAPVQRDEYPQTGDHHGEFPRPPPEIEPQAPGNQREENVDYNEYEELRSIEKCKYRAAWAAAFLAGLCELGFFLAHGQLEWWEFGAFFAFYTAIGVAFGLLLSMHILVLGAERRAARSK